MIRTSFCAGVILLLAGCANTTPRAAIPGAQQVVAPASPQQSAALLDRIKSLAGTWEMADEKGKYITAAVFTVSSGGSVVREVMFPGDAHEMTNMYHMDGPSLLVTHYCAVGNQPRMRAVAQEAQADRIVFKFDGVTNMTSRDQNCMGELIVIFKDADHVRQEWGCYKDGKTAEHAKFELRRKKS